MLKGVVFIVKYIEVFQSYVLIYALKLQLPKYSENMSANNSFKKCSFALNPELIF